MRPLIRFLIPPLAVASLLLAACTAISLEVAARLAKMTDPAERVRREWRRQLRR